MKNEKQKNENIYFSRERVDNRFRILEREICLHFILSFLQYKLHRILQNKSNNYINEYLAS